MRWSFRPRSTSRTASSRWSKSPARTSGSTACWRIEEDLWKHARVDTPFGKIPSTNVEVNGDHLQSLARLYTMTGREEFVIWSERLADYYFAQPDFVPERLRDHGCEIIGGLGLLLAVETQNHRPKAKEYQEKLQRMFDTILAKGCNEDGLMFNHITKRDGDNGRLSDGWGYNYVGYLCYDMAVGRPVYRDRVQRTLGNLLKPLYDNYNWEGKYSIDGFADSIEGGIYLLNRVPVKEGFAWVDREMARSVTRSNEPLDTCQALGHDEAGGQRRPHRPDARPDAHAGPDRPPLAKRPATRRRPHERRPRHRDEIRQALVRQAPLRHPASPRVPGLHARTGPA